MCFNPCSRHNWSQWDCDACRALANAETATRKAAEEESHQRLVGMNLLREERDAALAETARLKAALEKVIEGVRSAQDNAPDGYDYEEMIAATLTEARAALEVK